MATASKILNVISACLYPIAVVFYIVAWANDKALQAMWFVNIFLVILPMLFGEIICILTVRAINNDDKQIALGVLDLIFGCLPGGILYLVWNPYAYLRRSYTSESRQYGSASTFGNYGNTNSVSSNYKKQIVAPYIGQKVRNLREVFIGEERIPENSLGEIKSINGSTLIVAFVVGNIRLSAKLNAKDLCQDGSIPSQSSKIEEDSEQEKKTGTAVTHSTAEKPQPSTVEKPQPQKDDKFEEIIKFKDLLDRGIITQDEFERKKKELLNL